MNKQDKSKIVSKTVSKAATKFKLEDLIQQLQAFSLGLRHEHWETVSYETHKNVEQAQESLDGLIDDFVEAYVGMCDGARPTFKKDLVSSTDEAPIISALDKLDVKDSAILNIRDEMLQVLYKYKYLKTLK